MWKTTRLSKVLALLANNNKVVKGNNSRKTDKMVKNLFKSKTPKHKLSRIS